MIRVNEMQLSGRKYFHIDYLYGGAFQKYRPPPPGQKVLAFFTAFLHNTVLIHRLPNMDFSEFLTNYITTTFHYTFIAIPPIHLPNYTLHNLLYDHRVSPVPPDYSDYPDRLDYSDYYYYHLP